ncbi:Peptidase S24/S26A/S26B/S26C family protein [Rhynchospora pubera]|uniref:Peptidase S24/S26A/S26B/S26C family protein n=1 Tax=Rhynchospora pubera TaxID=906938 RepID=A0AAV8EDL2_9POAL|nr:Peptidase S24/S26A/S26B/S26C family protein [Rhynchospora pubera]
MVNDKMSSDWRVRERACTTASEALSTGVLLLSSSNKTPFLLLRNTRTTQIEVLDFELEKGPSLFLFELRLRETACEWCVRLLGFQRLSFCVEMVSLSTWVRYAAKKFEYSVSLGWKKYNVGQINVTELSDAIWKNFFQGRLTFMHWTKGEEMIPIISSGGTLLVRKIPSPTPTQVFVGDVVLMKDPEKSDNYIVRRLAAIEGYEMVSTDEKEEPFVLDMDQCWVLSDNSSLKSKEARDSRLFGPVPMTDIFGRVIYSLRSAVDHGPVENSRSAMIQDRPVLAVELDVEEMAKNSKS